MYQNWKSGFDLAPVYFSSATETQRKKQDQNKQADEQDWCWGLVVVWPPQCLVASPGLFSFIQEIQSPILLTGSCCTSLLTL